jgi:hypothetical protein
VQDVIFSPAVLHNIMQLHHIHSFMCFSTQLFVTGFVKAGVVFYLPVPKRVDMLVFWGQQQRQHPEGLR